MGLKYVHNKQCGLGSYGNHIKSVAFLTCLFFEIFSTLIFQYRNSKPGDVKNIINARKLFYALSLQ